MQFFSYLGVLFNRAAQKSVLLTDRLTILIVPFATLALWIAGAEMTESIQETLFLGVAITVMAVVALRLMAASYFVWKDDQVRKQDLQAVIDEPSRESYAALKRHTIELRQKLSDRLARLAAFAVYPDSARQINKEFETNFGKLLLEIDTLINQLSYDFPVRVASIGLRDYCLKLITESRDPGKHFWEQRRLTFRLLHKEDIVSDFMTLMELEVLLEDAGVKGIERPTDVVEELKVLIRRLGPNYHDAENIEQIKATLRQGGKINLF